MFPKTPAAIIGPTLLALALLACSIREKPPERRIDQRLIAETSEVFDRQLVAQWQDVFTWTFHHAADLAPWRQQGFDLMAKQLADHWRLGASQHGAFIERETSFHSADIDRLEVVLEGTGRRPLQLLWAGPGEGFEPRRSLEVRGEDADNRYLFDLRGHDQWQGEIARLRWVPRLPSKLRARLVSIRGQRSVVTAEALQQASKRPFKVSLGGTTRTARPVAADGDPLTWAVTIDESTHLEAAFGIDAWQGDGLSFRITGVDAQGMAHHLFSDDVAAGSTRQPRSWHQIELDLSPWAGQALELQFTVAPLAIQDEPTPPTLDIYGFWGDLRLTRPAVGEPPPNVVLVVIDTLRADHLSLYGYERPTSPHLDRWAAEQALAFRSVVAAAPWTYPSHLSLFTGLDTLSHGQHHPRPLPRRFDLLAQQLQREGYDTLAVTGGGYLDPHYGFARGFDRYAVIPGHLGPKGDLEDGIERALQWTAEAHRPYFLFLHTYEVHTPHRIRAPFYRQLSGTDGDPQRLARLTTRPLPEGDTAGAVRRKTYAWNDGQGGTEKLAQGELQQVIDAYDSAIAYTDHHLGRLLDHLTADDSDEVVVITSDHGEAFGEHGLADHAYLYDFNLRVPLVLSLPDHRGAGGWVEGQVRQIDVAPTILAALGFEGPAVDGSSLLPFFDDTTYRPPAAATEAWSATAYQGLSLRRGNRLKYVFNPTLWQREKARQALFLLDRDPDENHDLTAEHRATAELERLAMARFMENFDGLLITLDNPSSHPFQLTLEGPSWLGPQFFKSVDAAAGSLRWEDSQLHIDIGAGQRFSLVVEQVNPEDPLNLQLDGPNGRCAFNSPSSDVQRGEALLQRAFNSLCEVISEPQPDSFALTFLYRHSDPGSTASVGDALPQALTDQLRALGYLD